MLVSHLLRPGRSLAIVLILLVAMLAGLVVTAHPAAAAPLNYISGSACTKGLNPVWQSADTWIMYGNVTVVPGCTLTIEPGAFVRVDPGVRL
ncbi:MAG: hypothetical protein WC985_11155, partial [Thermoplasmata archaeon]